MIISNSRSTSQISTIFLVLLFWGLNVGFSIWEGSDALTDFESFPFFEIVISQLTILGIAVFLNFSFQKNKFVGVGDGLVGVVFLIFMLGLNDMFLYYRELLSLLLISIANLRLIALHNISKNYLREFEIGLFLGLAVVVAPSMFVISIMFLIGLTLVVSFTWRDFVSPLLGYLWVFFIKYIYLFWINDFSVDSSFFFSYPKFDAQFNIQQILITLVSMYEFAVLVKLFGVIEKRNIKERIHYWLWIWTAVFMFISLLFFQETFNKFLLIVLLGLPCSIFSIEYFPKKEKPKGQWKQEAILFGLIFIQLALRVL